MNVSAGVSDMTPKMLKTERSGRGGEGGGRGFHTVPLYSISTVHHFLRQVLFELARYHAPSTIFVDEVDALMATRQGEQEHEASRRMKTQLLVELDGLTQGNHHVFLLAASNIPW